MPWIKIDDKWSNHPKLVTVGPLGKALFMDALCYSSQYLTDGFIPALVADQLCYQFQDLMEIGAVDNVRQPIKWLVAQDLWSEVDGGYEIHDYLEFNPSRAQVESEREQAKERMKRAREQKPSSDDVRPKFNRSSDNPVPSPVPVPHVPSEPNGSSEQKTTPKPPRGEPVEFANFYDEYPRHTDRQNALKAWNKLNPSPELVQEIMTGMRKLLPDYHAREPDKVPHPSTFLNGGRWRDEPVKKQGSVLDGTKPAFVNGRQNYTEDEGKEYLRRHGWITEQ